MNVTGVLESCLYAADLVAAERFYTVVLKLPVHAREHGRHVFFRCGRGMFLIFNPAHTAATPTQVDGQSVPLHGAQGAGHVAFAVPDADLDTWREHLRGQGVSIESEVAWPQGGHSIYFRDPAGNSVELATPRLWGV